MPRTIKNTSNTLSDSNFAALLKAKENLKTPKEKLPKKERELKVWPKNTEAPSTEVVEDVNNIPVEQPEQPKIIAEPTPEVKEVKKDRISEKAKGAISEIQRRANLNKEIEEGLREGRPVKGYERMNKKTDLVVAKSETDIAKTTGDSKALDEFEKSLAEARVGAEESITDPFTRSLYDKMGTVNKLMFLGYSEDYLIKPGAVELIPANQVCQGNDNVALFSENGYLLKLMNKGKSCKSGVVEDIDSETAIFNLIAPDGKIAAQKLDYEMAMMAIKDMAKEYQEEQLKEFYKNNKNISLENKVVEAAPENKVEALAIIPKNKIDVESATKEKIAAANKMLDDLLYNSEYQDKNLDRGEMAAELMSGMLAEDEQNKKQAETEKEYFDNFNGKASKEGLIKVGSKESVDPRSISDEAFLGFVDFVRTNGMTKEDLEKTEAFVGLSQEQKEKILGVYDEAKKEPETGASAESEKEADLKNDEKPAAEDEVKTERLSDEEMQQAVIFIQAEGVTKERLQGFFETEEKFKKLPQDQKEILWEACGRKMMVPIEKIKPEDMKLVPSISSYAESIGIKKEEFSEYPDFLNLKPEEQQLVLETLRRSSLVLAKAQARENLNQEKSEKKGFKKLSYSFQEKYHKQRHEALAMKEIEDKGIEGYGRSEFELLVKVVKEGVEVKNNGDVNFLNESRMSNKIESSLLNDYNKAARTYVETSSKDISLFDAVEVKEAEETMNNFKNKILQVASVGDMNNLRTAENNIKLFKYLSADKETGKAVEKLSANTLSGGNKAKMMWNAHKDKAGYMAGGLSIKMLAKFAMAINYSIAPAVAAVIGGIRGYNMSTHDIKDKQEFAQIGFKDKDRSTAGFAKTMNEAVGKNEKGANLGLSDKLDSLVSRFEDLQEVQKTETDPKEIEKNNRNIDSLKDLLNDRIVYTIGRINDHEVSYGPAEERGANFYKLNDSLIAAQVAMSYRFNPFNTISNYKDVDRSVTKATRSKLEYEKLPKIKGESEAVYNERVKQMNAEYFAAIKAGKLTENVIQQKSDYKFENKTYIDLVNDENRLEKLKQISFEDRLASFMGYKEDIRADKQFVYVAKKVAMGAAMGATFAAAGVWVADKIGLDVFFSKGLNTVKDIFSHHDATSVLTPGAKIPTVVGGKIPGAVDGRVPNPVNTPSAKTPITEGGKNIVGTDKISNENLNGKHDSVWRSTRKIFEDKATELGFKGDPSNVSAVNQWAETQTANAIHNSGGVADRVVEGNQVNLMRDGDHFKVVVEKGSGTTPGHLDHNVGGGHEQAPSSSNTPETPSANTPTEKVLYNNDFKPITNEDNNLKELIDAKANMEKNLVNALLEQKVLAGNLHLKPEYMTRIDAGHFSYKIPGKGEMFIGYKDDASVIEKLTDFSGKNIPTNLIDDIRRTLSVDRFVSRGGLEKVFSTWNGLDSHHKIIYQDMSSLKGNLMRPAEFLNKICQEFHVNANNGVMIDSDLKHFIYKGHRSFDTDLKGLEKLIKILSRRDL